MREKLQTAAAVMVLLAAGGGLTWFGASLFARLAGVESAQAGLVDDLNNRVLPGVQKRLEKLEPKAPPAATAKKGE